MSSAINHMTRSHRSEHRKATFLAKPKNGPTRNKYATQNRAQRRRMFRKVRKWLDERRNAGEAK